MDTQDTLIEKYKFSGGKAQEKLSCSSGETELYKLCSKRFGIESFAEQVVQSW